MHAYYQAIIDAYAQAGRPYFHQVEPQEARAMLKAGMAAAPPPVNMPAAATVTDFEIDGPHGAIAVRSYAPAGGHSGAVVYFHSGGWVIGDLDQADTTCRRLADASGAEVLSIDYRLAPEHPFPQPFDDAYAAVLWAAQARPRPLLVMGESAGGNLATACTLKARDTGGPQLVGQVLAYPVTDCDFDTPSYIDVGSRNLLLSRNDMMWFWNHYCPSQLDRTHPYVSPLRAADLSGLPPAFIAVAELDPLHDEGLAYAARLRDAGVEVATRDDAGVLHGYLGAAGIVPASTEALSQIGAWIGARVAAAQVAREQANG